MIDAEILSNLWPLLLLLAAALVMAVLSVLASYQRHAIELHDAVREGRIKRLEHFASLEKDGRNPMKV